MLQIGTVCWWVVGMPGPDLDICVIAGYSETGAYIVRHKVWGRGEWLTDESHTVFEITHGCDDPHYDEAIQLGQQLAREYYGTDNCTNSVKHYTSRK